MIKNPFEENVINIKDRKNVWVKIRITNEIINTGFYYLSNNSMLEKFLKDMQERLLEILEAKKIITAGTKNKYDNHIPEVDRSSIWLIEELDKIQTISKEKMTMIKKTEKLIRADFVIRILLIIKNNNDLTKKGKEFIKYLEIE